jgi:hypothetical protein
MKYDVPAQKGLRKPVKMRLYSITPKGKAVGRMDCIFISIFSKRRIEYRLL